MRRHLIIPDTQLHPGLEPHQLEHIDWAAAAIVDYKPDVIVVLGDWWDMHSLSSHDAPGSEPMEGARYMDDVAIGCEMFARLVAPMRKEQERLRRNKDKLWRTEEHFLEGNHEWRIQRAVKNEPKYAGALTREHLNVQGFQYHNFLEIVEIDGISYSHYFANTHSGRPIGGSIESRLNKIGRTFVQGHEQGFLYGTRQFPGNIRRHGLVAGSFYQHTESYRGAQGRDEWRGIVVLNEAQGPHGDFCIMPLTIDYLRRRYG
jgi:hypothetical protein